MAVWTLPRPPLEALSLPMWGSRDALPGGSDAGGAQESARVWGHFFTLRLPRTQMPPAGLRGQTLGGGWEGHKNGLCVNVHFLQQDVQASRGRGICATVCAHMCRLRCTCGGGSCEPVLMMCAVCGFSAHSVVLAGMCLRWSQGEWGHGKKKCATCFKLCICLPVHLYMPSCAPLCKLPFQ